MSDLEYKCVGAGCEVTDEARGEVVAVVATTNRVDKGHDVILSNSVQPRTGAPVKISNYAHDVILDGGAPVGKGVIAEEGNELVLRGRYFMTTERGREAFNTVKELGSDGQFSFGFPRSMETAPLTDEWRAKGARRIIRGIQPIEASPVFIGEGVGTRLVSAKCSECGGHAAKSTGNTGVASGVGILVPAATGPEASFYRWDEAASRLWLLVLIFNAGATTPWVDSPAWWTRLEQIYGDRYGEDAGATTVPSYTPGAARAIGLADLFGRLDVVSSLERQMGTALPMFRAARGALATPMSSDIAKLLPPRPTTPNFIGDTPAPNKALKPPRPADFKESIPDYAAERAARRVFDAVLAGRTGWKLRTRPPLHWFKGPIARCSGQFLDDQSPPEVWISTGLDPLTTGIAAGHECFHNFELEQQRAGKSYGYSDARAEAHARYLVDRLVAEGVLP